jgi:hypothetical protein
VSRFAPQLSLRRDRKIPNRINPRNPGRKTDCCSPTTMLAFALDPSA